MHYLIEEKVSSDNSYNKGWRQMRGRRYKTLKAALRAYKKLEKIHDEAARSGRIHPSWYGKFALYHRIRKVED